MDKKERDFIELIKRAITLQYVDDGYFDETDWETMYKFSASNGIMALLFEEASYQKSLTDEMRKKWDHGKFAISVSELKHLFWLNKVLEKVKQNGIDYALFKGPILADCYPNISYRSSSDSDILVNEKDRDAVCEIITGLGYELYEQGCNAQVNCFVHKDVGHVIELHTCLFEHYQGTKISILKAMNLENPKKRYDCKINGYTFRTLGVNEHLVYLFFHLIKHFVLEGASVRFFTDITLFINKYVDKIDADYFWGCMYKCDYAKFCENFLTICINYFDMDNTIMKGHECKADAEVLEELLVDCIYGGDKDNKRKKRWQLLGTMRPYLVGSNTAIKKSKAKRIIQYIFIKPEELNKSYRYAKKMPVLLPVAWLHRGIKRIFVPLFYRKNVTYTGIEKIKMVDDRLKLFASVGIIDED